MATNQVSSKQEKCKYWDQCYRKDANHKKNFLHPADLASSKPAFDITGKRVVFTGKFCNSSPDDMRTDAEARGCFVGSTLTKTVDILVAGENAENSVDKAKKQGTKVLTESEWVKLIKMSKQMSVSKTVGKATRGASSASQNKTALKKAHAISDSDDDTDTETSPSPPKKQKSNSSIGSASSSTSDVPKLTRSRSKSMSSKPKCKNWMTCTNNDKQHAEDFQHPNDLMVGSFYMPGETSAAKFSASADSGAPLPVTVMSPGETRVLTGGLRQEHKFTLTCVDAKSYTCTCSSWTGQSKAPNKRTCKHIKNLLGDEYDLYRVGKMTGSPADEKITRGPRYKAIGSLMLAHKWTDDVNPKGWWMSEKLDGVRAYWDGRTFYSRLGNEFIAPSWFTEGFPSDMELDGELFGGRGKFQSTVSIVKTPGSGRWSEVKYYIFDAPKLKLPFEERIQAIRDYFEKNPNDRVFVLEHVKCKDADDLKTELKRVNAKGGEGVMIRKPKSPYEHRRSKDLLKIKTFHDAEAKIIGYEKGKGRNAAVMGAIVCLMECGKTFKVGTGFTDQQRRSPPKKGTIITYRFQEYTNAGIPRFPSYIGERIDIAGPKDVVLPPNPNAD